MRRDGLLCSINDRLEALCAHFGASKQGRDVPPLTTDYLDELALFVIANDEDLMGDPDEDAEGEDE